MQRIEFSLDRHDLLQKRRIYLFGDVTPDMALHVIQQSDFLCERGKEPISLMIFSDGGCVASCLAIIDQMQALQSQGILVRTIVVGNACSAAALILALGSKGERYVRPSSMVMMHPMSYGLHRDYEQFQENATRYFKAEQILNNKLLAEACGKSLAKLTKDIQHGLWLRGQKVVDYGAADKVLVESNETSRQ